MTAVSSKHSALIVGAGIAGLTAAYTLQQQGWEVQVLEASDQVGGAMQSHFTRGYLLEAGPHSFLASAPRLVRLLEDLDLRDQVLRAAPAARRRYLYWQGRLLPVPMGPLALLGTPLLSLKGKVRLLAEPWPRRGADQRESLADFVCRRCGPEVLERLVGPFVSGVFAGDPAGLAVAAAFPRVWQWEQSWGSVLVGALLGRRPSRLLPRGTYALREGMGSLPLALADRLPGQVFIRSRLLQVTPRAGGGFTATLSINGREHSRTYTALVLACPAYAAAELVKSFAPGASSALAAIPYPPLAVVATGFPTAALPTPLDGFGFLAPRGQGLRLLGTIWNSTVFPGRAPEGMTLLTSFIGGAFDPEILSLTDEQLLAAVRADLAKAMGIQADPAFVHVFRYARAIPQYGPEHADRIAALVAAEQASPGLGFVGNYRGGVSVEHTIASARETAFYLAE